MAILDRQGLWQVGEKRGSASLLSRRETILHPGSSSTAAQQVTVAGSLLRGDLRPLLLWLVFALLLLEAWLFHRHAVH